MRLYYKCDAGMCVRYEHLAYACAFAMTSYLARVRTNDKLQAIKQDSKERYAWHASDGTRLASRLTGCLSRSSQVSLFYCYLTLRLP